MNSFPINFCAGNTLKTMLACPADPYTKRVIDCNDCIHSSNKHKTSNIPNTKKKFLRDMIFSTGDFDEE